MSKKQVTLVGNFARGKSNTFVCYKNPECFIERYCLRNWVRGKGDRKDQIVKKAQEAWKNTLRGNVAELLKLRERERPFVTCDNFGYEIGDNVVKKSNFIGVITKGDKAEADSIGNRTYDKNNGDLDTSDITLSSECSSSNAYSNTPDASEILRKGKIESGIFDKTSFEHFCDIFCKELCTEEVVNNTSFVEGIVNDNKNIVQFHNLYTTYDASHSRKRTDTELSKITNNIRSSISDNVMIKASEVQISTKSGLETMMQSMQGKNNLLKDILTSALGISNLIQVTSVIYKMRKRISQLQDKTKGTIKGAISNSTILKCMNTKLTWDSAYINA